MRLYHGTTAEKAEKIEEKGFKVGKSRYTDLEENCIYFSDTYEYAEQHGYVIEIEVPEEYVEFVQENPLGPEDPGYVPGDEYCVDIEHIDEIKIID